MKSIKLIQLILFINLLFSQKLNIDQSIPYNIPQNKNLDIQQSFGLTMINANGISNSNAIFSNNINYSITDKIKLKSNLHFISPLIKDYNNPNKLDIKYDLLLDYKVFDNFEIKLKMTNLSYNNQFGIIRNSNSILINE